MEKLLWGVDLGGTKIEGAVLRADNLSDPLCRIRVETEQEHGYAHILDQCAKLIAQMEDSVGARPVTIGFGTPGVLDPHLNAMKNCNTQCLNGKPLRDDLTKRLGVPCVTSNDANCFALAESLMGAGKGSSTCFGVILGTGVGGGVVVHGRALHGYQGIAGEWGHNILEENGAPCYCGKRGCVEQCFSGPALQRYYESLSGERVKVPEIVRRAEVGDVHAIQTVERLISLFGKAISVVINILDPEVVVLGGGVSNVDLLYTRGRDEVKKYVFNNRLDTKIVKHSLGDSAGVFGAALLVAPLLSGE